jgi:GABA(A) receptor-associated protein
LLFPFAMAESPFKDSLTLQRRREISAKILATHNDKVPVIVNAAVASLPQLQKQKFLAPKHFTMAQFISEMLDQLPVDGTMHMCFFVGKGVAAMPAQLMQQIYEQYKDEDGFLYVTYNEHKTYGGR